jgi:endonuclease IV
MLGHHFHIDKRKNLAVAISEDIEEFGSTCGQIFLANNRSGVLTKCPVSELETASTIPIAVHGAYTNSLWTKSKSQTTSIALQLDMCEVLGYVGMVFHHGKKTTDQILDGLNRQPETKTKILLEQSACKPSPTQTHETPEKLNRLISMLIARATRPWGIVIDTAHIWAMGVELGTRDDVNQFFNAIEHPDRIDLIHFNGSYSPKGSGKDKHAIPAGPDDNIWDRQNRDGWKALIEFGRSHNIPMIMEVNRGSTDDLKYIYEHNN